MPPHDVYMCCPYGAPWRRDFRYGFGCEGRELSSWYDVCVDGEVLDSFPNAPSSTGCYEYVHLEIGKKQKCMGNEVC